MSNFSWFSSSRLKRGIEANMERAPFPTEIEEFNEDERISYDQVTQSHKLEDERGEEWEWLTRLGKWVPVVCNSQNPVLAVDRLWPAYIP